MQYRFFFIVGVVVLLSPAPVRADAQATSKCARSFCGCPTPVDRALAVFVNDQAGGKPVSGIELRCEEPSPVLATTDAAGRISTTVKVYTTPGCGIVRCRELLAIDPSGRYATSKIRFPESETTLSLERVDAKVATATEQPDPGPCAANEDAGPTTSMLRACAEQKLAAADASLDSYVRSLAGAADGEDRSAKQAAALEKAQSAWRTDRDATCELVYGEVFPGSMAAVQRLECRTLEAEQRLARLQRIFSPADDYLPQ